jgi:hypothetical protein
MTNNKQQTAVDSIIEFCQKQMESDSSIHKGVYLSIIKFCQEQAKEMEKEQHRVTAEDFYYGNWEYKKFHDYYKETYGGGEL